MNKHHRFVVATCIFMAVKFSAAAQSLIICFDEKCEVVIKGNTNVAPYQCSLNQPPAFDTLDVYSYTKDDLFYLENAIIKLPAQSFFCDNKMMTDDFLEALKADVFPHVSLEFTYFKLKQPLAHMPLQKNIPVKFYVTIAGVKKAFYSTYDEIRLADNILFLSGNISISMGDFNITPPSALFGAIRVSDKIKMQFNVRFCISN